MKNHRVEYSIEDMCAGLGVSRSGYYAWLQRKPSGRSEQRKHLDEWVKALFEKHKSRYGAKRIQRQIQQDDQPHYPLKTVAGCQPATVGPCYQGRPEIQGNDPPHT